MSVLFSMKSHNEAEQLALSTEEAEDQQAFSLKRAFSLLKDYFVNSDEKWIAWLLLAGIIMSILAFVGILVVLSWWTAGFWTAIATHTWLPVLISLGKFAVLLAGIVFADVLKNYQTGVLSILWRNWLTQKFKKRLLDNDNYLKLTRTATEIDNIAQRIQNDIGVVVNTTLSLASDFFRSILTFGTFVGTLWVIGGALSFVLLGLNIVIPGYLVWVALIAAVAATIITYYVGKSLEKTAVNLESAEADLRQNITVLNEDAENIATAKAKDYYDQKMDIAIDKVSLLSDDELNTETQVTAFQSSYMQISSILPILASIPLYFTGLIQLTDIMQISFAFMEVNESLSWFSNNYQLTSKYKSSVVRVLQLQDALDKAEAHSPFMAIRVQEKSGSPDICIRNLSVRHPGATDSFMFRKLDLTLRKGENTLIQGDSGLGKSTLVKVLSKNWDFGEGEISLPADTSICCLPQFASIPKDTLKGILAFPKPETTYTDSECMAALTAVGKMEAFIPLIGSKKPDIRLQKLSGGQKQRIAFARVLLQKPDWVILDEATASLGTKSQSRIYGVLAKFLPKTTIVSIGQRDELRALHTRNVFFKANKAKEIEVREQGIPLLTA